MLQTMLRLAFIEPYSMMVKMSISFYGSIVG